jgi:hypothetical protein
VLQGSPSRDSKVQRTLSNAQKTYHFTGRGFDFTFTGL